MKSIKLLNSIVLSSSILTPIALVSTSCSNTKLVDIQDKTYYANMGGIGVYYLNFKQDIVWDDINNIYHIPLISITNLKAYDQDNNEVFLPYGGHYLAPAYTYDDTHKVCVSVIPSDSVSSLLKYINTFSFDFNIKWIETNSIDDVQTTLPSWSQTIDNVCLNYISKISIRSKQCYLLRGDTKLTLYFTLHTKVEYNQSIRITTTPKVDGLGVMPLSGIVIGNGYIKEDFSVTYIQNKDLLNANFDITFECIDQNKQTIWTQTLTDFTIDVLANKFDLKEHSPVIAPSAKAIVEAGENGLDYTFDLYMYEDYEQFDADVWIESIQDDPYIKSITCKKHEYVYDEEQQRHKLSITINIVCNMEIGYGKACWFRLRIKPTNHDWDHVLQLTMVCKA